MEKSYILSMGVCFIIKIFQIFIEPYKIIEKTPFKVLKNKGLQKKNTIMYLYWTL